MKNLCSSAASCIWRSNLQTTCKMDLSSDVGTPLLLTSRNKGNLLLSPLLEHDVNLFWKGSSVWGPADKRAARLNPQGNLCPMTPGQPSLGDDVVEIPPDTPEKLIKKVSYLWAVLHTEVFYKHLRNTDSMNALNVQRQIDFMYNNRTGVCCKLSLSLNTPFALGWHRRVQSCSTAQQR